MKHPKLEVDLTPEHAELQQFVGEWHGQTKTWLYPEDPPDQCETHSRISLLLGGLFLLEKYTGSVGGKPHEGVRTYGFDTQRKNYTCTWIDNFHMGSAVMHSEGVIEENKLILSGEYSHQNETWGWKTLIRLTDIDSLLITQYNVSPIGQQDLAVESRMSKVPTAF